MEALGDALGLSARNWLTSPLAPLPWYREGREGSREGRRKEGKKERGREAFSLQMGRNPNGKSRYKSKVYLKPLSTTDPSEVSSEALAPIL